MADNPFRRKGIKIVKWRFDCPADIAFRFENLYKSQHTGEVLKGARSTILSNLLLEHIKAREAALKIKHERKEAGI